MNARFHVVVEDLNMGMDDGCTHDILQACTNHGKVLAAYFVADDGEIINVMHEAKHLTPEPEKC